MFNTEGHQSAVLTVLYTLEPQDVGDPFIEVRRWETISGEYSELIVETGYVDETGELQTNCQVLPFHLSINQVLHSIGR